MTLIDSGLISQAEWDALPSVRRARIVRTEQQRMETESLIEEFESLKGSDKPKAIATRMGYKPSSLARRFIRYGRHDLARGLWD